MIDIHTHLLPGVDDGSPTAEHSVLVLRRMYAAGITGVVCTPHLNASAVDDAPRAEHLSLLDDLRERAPVGLELHAGWEIMLDRFGTDLTDPSFALSGSRARLVEFSRRALPTGATAELLRLRAAGIVPVVAHPERYNACTLETMAGWREAGVVIQTGATALIGGGLTSERARSMLAEGLIDVLASDNHGDRRSLSTARQWMEEIGAREQAILVTAENPRRLLEDSPLVPVEPFRTERSVFDRLKAMLLGRRRATADNMVPNDD